MSDTKKVINPTYFAYLSDKGKLMPSTIREKEGDSEGIAKKIATYRKCDFSLFKAVTVIVNIVE